MGHCRLSVIVFWPFYRPYVTMLSCFVHATLLKFTTDPLPVPSCVLIIPLTPLPLDPKVSQSQRKTSESAFISHRRRRAKPPGSPAVCSVGSGCTGLAEWECFAVWCVKQCWQIPTRTGRYFFYAFVGGMCQVIFYLCFFKNYFYPVTWISGETLFFCQLSNKNPVNPAVPSGSLTVMLCCALDWCWCFLIIMWQY